MPDAGESAVALGTEIDLDVREGRFQRWLSLIAGMSSVLAGLEVRLRALSWQLQPARDVHARDPQRRAGEWRDCRFLQQAFGAYNAAGDFSNHLGGQCHRLLLPHTRGSPKTRRLAASHCQHGHGTSHLKNNFRYKAQWTPVIIAPMLMAAGAGAVKSRKAAHTWLPAMSALAMADGAVGFFYHARGVLRRPGGMKKPLYNVIYGPPIFAPLLFAASGFLGLLASMLGREKRK